MAKRMVSEVFDLLNELDDIGVLELFNCAAGEALRRGFSALELRDHVSKRHREKVLDDEAFRKVQGRAPRNW